MLHGAGFTDSSPLNGAAGIIFHLTRYVVVSPVGRARSELRMENTHNRNDTSFYQWQFKNCWTKKRQQEGGFLVSKANMS